MDYAAVLRKLDALAEDERAPDAERDMAKEKAALIREKHSPDESRMPTPLGDLLRNLKWEFNGEVYTDQDLFGTM